MDDDAIRTLVKRLARVHPSGGSVVQRAAVVAEGSASEEILAWIVAHGGKPEVIEQKVVSRGLHERRHETVGGSERRAAQFVLPAGALD